MDAATHERYGYCCRPTPGAHARSSLNLDLLVFLPQPDSSGVGVEEMERDLSWWGRTLATMTTVLIGLWLQFIARRWQRAQPKHVQMASAMFTLTPEFLAIAVVLDVGKLAYPASATLSLVLLLVRHA